MPGIMKKLWNFGSHFKIKSNNPSQLIFVGGLARNLQYVSYNASTDAHKCEVTPENIDEYIEKLRRIEKHENEIERDTKDKVRR